MEMDTLPIFSIITALENAYPKPNNLFLKKMKNNGKVN